MKPTLQQYMHYAQNTVSQMPGSDIVQYLQHALEDKQKNGCEDSIGYYSTFLQQESLIKMRLQELALTSHYHAGMAIIDKLMLDYGS